MVREIRKILFITLSNVGDVVLTTPVMNILCQRYPHAHFTILVGPKASSVFDGDPLVDEVIEYNKKASLKEKCTLVRTLRRKNYDAVCDLRHTIIPIFLQGTLLTRLIRRKEEGLHAAIDHMRKLKNVSPQETPCFRLFASEKALDFQKEIWQKYAVGETEPVFGISPHAASSLKQWPIDRCIELIKNIQSQYTARCVLIGGNDARDIGESIMDSCPQCINLIGHTSISELIAIMSKMKGFVTNDSGPLHIASALDVPTVAIFGPSDDVRYGPRGKNHCIVHDINCRPCKLAQCKFSTHECIKSIGVKEVFDAVHNLGVI
ncbi:MAG: glycosyltransferase family 9 protein [Candidatus Ancaeobacter aquaticus]|nr:glycosyltransferase family 9 protein [Candidatus Ancaeobacter aquaticus]